MPGQPDGLTSAFVVSCLERWPHPLPDLLRRYWVSREPDAATSSPTLPPSIEACLDLSSTLLRFAALLLLAERLQARRQTPRTEPELNRQILRTLQSPSDGNWLELCRRMTAGDDGVGRLAQLFNVVDGDVWAKFEQLIQFRNDCVHGNAPTRERVVEAAAQLEMVAERLAGLGSLTILVNDDDGRMLTFRGIVPQDIVTVGVGAANEPVGRPYLWQGDGQPVLSLWPFLVYVDANSSSGLQLSEMCYFSRVAVRAVEYAVYRRAGRIGSERLGIIGAESYAEFARWMSRIADEAAPDVLPPPGFDDRLLLEGLLKYFVGRRDELQQIVDWILGEAAGYGAITGTAGSGKSAILASLRKEVETSDSRLSLGSVRFAWHFCQRREGRNDLIRILRSLCHQIQEVCRDILPRPRGGLPKSLAELQTWLVNLLEQISAKNLEAQAPFKLVIVLDALDEATPFAGAADQLLGRFPDPLPTGVIVLASYRIAEDGEPLVRLGDRGMRMMPVLRAPLPALDRESIRELLRVRLNRPKWAADREFVESIWQRSGGDPLYLYFLAESMQGQSADARAQDLAPTGIESFFRRRLWSRLPTADDGRAHRLLLLLAALRIPCTDVWAGELLHVPEYEVTSLRRHFGSFLTYTTAADGETAYQMYHDRLRAYLQQEFPAEELADMHQVLVLALEADLPERTEPSHLDLGPTERRAYAEITFHRFELGRLNAEFDALFAAHDAGFFEQKLAALNDPSAVAEDFALLLRACLMVDDLPRAYRGALERAVVSTEVHWLGIPGMPGLLMRLAGDRPGFRSMLTGAIELMPDRNDRLAALADIATSIAEPATALPMIRSLLSTLEGESNLKASASWLGRFIGQAALFSELTDELLEFMERQADSAASWSDEFGLWLPAWPEPRLAVGYLRAVAKGFQKPPVKAKDERLARKGESEDLIDLVSRAQSEEVNLNAFKAVVLPGTVAQFLRPWLWLSVAEEQRPMLDAIGQVLQELKVASTEWSLLSAIAAARAGDRAGQRQAIEQAFARLGAEDPLASTLAYMGMTLFRLEVPGCPLAAAPAAADRPDRDLSFRLGMQLFPYAERHVPEGKRVDLRGKRSTETAIIIESNAHENGGLAEVFALRAAGHSGLGCEGAAHDDFAAAAEHLAKEPIQCWRTDLTTLLRAALAFPTPLQRAARVFETLRVVETTVGGLSKISQGLPASCLVEFLPILASSLPADVAHTVVQRTADAARAFSDDEARVRLLVACGRTISDLGDAEQARALLREVCLNLAYRDRTTNGVAGIPALHELTSDLAPEASERITHWLQKLVEADPARESLATLGEGWISLLPELPDTSQRERAADWLRGMLSTARFDAAPVAFLKQLAATVPTVCSAPTAKAVLDVLMQHVDSAQPDELPDWIEHLLPLALATRDEISVNRLVRDAQSLTRPDRRTQTCCKVINQLRAVHPRDPRIEPLLSAATPSEQDAEAVINARLDEVAASMGKTREDLRSMLDPTDSADNNEPANGLMLYIRKFVEKIMREAMTGLRQTQAVAQLRVASALAALQRWDEVAKLAQPAVDQLQNESGDPQELLAELTVLAEQCVEGAPSFAADLRDVLDDRVTEIGRTAGWLTYGCRLARLESLLGRRDRAVHLLCQRVHMAERAPRAFPHERFGALLDAIGEFGTDLGPLADQATRAVVGWPEKAIAVAGERAAGAIRYDVDRALFIANRADAGSSVKPQLALAEAVGPCQPAWANYAAYRLIENGAQLTRESLLSVLTILAARLPDGAVGASIQDGPETPPTSGHRGRLASVLLGPSGYDLLTAYQTDELPAEET